MNLPTANVIKHSTYTTMASQNKPFAHYNGYSMHKTEL